MPKAKPKTVPTGVSCLYIKKLEDVDLETLGQLIKASVERIAAKRLDK